MCFNNFHVINNVKELIIANVRNLKNIVSYMEAVTYVYRAKIIMVVKNFRCIVVNGQCFKFKFPSEHEKMVKIFKHKENEVV